MKKLYFLALSIYIATFYGDPDLWALKTPTPSYTPTLTATMTFTPTIRNTPTFTRTPDYTPTFTMSPTAHITPTPTPGNGGHSIPCGKGSGLGWFACLGALMLAKKKKKPEKPIEQQKPDYSIGECDICGYAEWSACLKSNNGCCYECRPHKDKS